MIIKRLHTTISELRSPNSEVGISEVEISEVEISEVEISEVEISEVEISEVGSQKFTNSKDEQNHRILLV